MKACSLLFQGDSITDAGRVRENPSDLGPGYPFYAAQLLRKKFPDTTFTFQNRGIGGDETKHILARIQPDLIDLQPDIVSIMVGINDTWHYAEGRNWLPTEVFELNYRRILERIRSETNAKIMILEQYLFPVPDKAYFAEDLHSKQACVRALANEYADVFLPTNELAQSVAAERGSETFTADGVHPNDTGARWLAEQYVHAIAPLLNSQKVDTGVITESDMEHH